MVYGIGLAKGMGVTLKTLLRPAFTVQYPDRRVGVMGAAKAAGISTPGLIFKRPIKAFRAVIGLERVAVRPTQSTRFRGNEFTWYEERCTGCASCAKYCPLGIIKIVTSPGGINVQEGESYAIDTFDIDIGRCMFCALCVEACPYDALHMGSSFERGNYVRMDLVLTKADLNAQAKHPSTWFRPQMEARDFSPFDDVIDDMKQAGRHEMPSVERLTERWVEDRKTDQAEDD
ncbi:MAG: 4Fe-4S binding protein [Chloroflexi bacterium]|nr:4Fe-4S binding protein [Chloroflexota bacterium]